MTAMTTMNAVVVTCASVGFTSHVSVHHVHHVHHESHARCSPLGALDRVHLCLALNILNLANELISEFCELVHKDLQKGLW